MSKICNSMVEVSKGIELNDKDYCTCLLSTLKDMEKNYCIAMTEASNEWLSNIYKDIFLDLADFQRRLYVLMFENGWYALENVTQTKLDEKLKMFSQEYDDLSNNE